MAGEYTGKDRESEGGEEKKWKTWEGSWKEAVKKKIRKACWSDGVVKVKGVGGFQLSLERCSIPRLDVPSRGNTSDFQSAAYRGAAVPFEPKQTECLLFSRSGRGGRQNGRNGLCFRFQLEDRGTRGERKRHGAIGGEGEERNGRRGSGQT